MTDRSSEERSREKTLLDKIAAAINEVSRENASNTPDFLLADFLGECLAAFERTSRAREKWYGKSLSIGCSEVGAIQSVAAPEDRQEAAPHVGGVCPKCHWFICQCQVPGVPSEATPSKENAIQAQIAEIAAHPASRLFQQVSPAPEVQGTPPEFRCSVCGEFMQFGASDKTVIHFEPCKHSGLAPVGAPQKETPKP